MKMMLFSLLCYICGLACLIVCSIIKLDVLVSDDPNTPKPPQGDNSDLPSNSSAVFYQFNDHSNTSWIETDTASSLRENPEESNISYLPILGIIGFCLCDIGYDTGNCLCRAYILECCPSDSHTNILITITGISSFAGLGMSIVGTVNFPAILGPMFHVDGTAATMLLLTSMILVFILISYLVTILIGYYINKRFNQAKYIKPARMSPSGMRRSKALAASRRLWKLQRKMKSRSLLTPSDPLLKNDELDNRSYSALSDASIDDSVSRPYGHDEVRGETDKQTESESRMGDRCDSRALLNDDQKETSQAITCLENPVSDHPADEAQDQVPIPLPVNEVATMVAAIKASYSMSMSVVMNTLTGDNANNKRYSKLGDISMQGEGSSNTGSVKPKKSIWRNKRLHVILLSMFFSIGSVLAFTMYSGNTLTIGVYHGEPMSLPGTPGRAEYERGLRSVALGTVIMYLTYFLAGLVNGKAVDLIGEKAYFIISHVIFAGISAAFLFTKKEELYFSTSAVMGLYRTCSFTLSYIMVHRLVKEESELNGDASGQVENIGQVMAAISFLLPSHYLLISCLVGPLISALNSVWIPAVLQLVDTVAALLIFLLLFFIKR